MEKGVPFLQSGHHHCHEGWIQTHCVFCSDGQSGWHLGYSIDGGNFNCWRCGPHRSKETFSRLLRVPEEEVGRALRPYFADPVQVRLDPVESKPKIRRREAKKPPHLGGLEGPHRRYLRSRGFVPRDLVRLWGLKGTGRWSQDWAWRIIAPIRNYSGSITAYTGRAISSKIRPKWKTSLDSHQTEDPRSSLYGIERATGGRILIVEGPSDVWRMGPGAVATMGINWKEEQIAILRKYPRRFILFDTEKQAQKQAQKLAEWLSGYKGETEILKLSAGDPGDLDPEAARSIMIELGFKRRGDE
jgi:hypothetical protein